MSSSGSSLHTFYLTNALDIREILEFKSSVLETGVDNPQRYYLSSVCNQVLGTNSIVLRVPSMHSGYYTYLEHRYNWTVRQWECYPYIDDDQGSVFDMQFPRRRVLFQSNQWWHDDGWFWLDYVVQIVSIRIQYKNRAFCGGTVCSIWRVIPCLIWRTTKVRDVMHTSIHSMSNKTGNWMYRVTDSSIAIRDNHKDE